MIRTALLLALVGCTAVPTEDVEGTDDGGKADGIVVPKKRRSMAAVKCPHADAPAKVAFFDADSTIRISKSGNVTADSPTDVNVLPFAARELKRLASEGYLIAVVSNQGGVAAGHQTLATAEKALAFAVAGMRKLGARVHYFDFAEKNDHFRKPKTGMAEMLETKLQSKCDSDVDWDASFMVGDSGYKKGVDGPHPDGRPADDFSNSDRLFAENLGIPFHEPTDFFGWRDYEVYNLAAPSELEAFLQGIDARAEELRADGDDEGADALEAEARTNRDVNEL